MYSLSTKKTRIGLLTAAVLVGSLAMTSVHAAKAPKVDICHFDADEGIFNPISVNGNAVSKHVENHGDQFPNVDPDDGGFTLDDDCFVIAPSPDVFARAFIDVNRNATYDGAVDIEISALVDTNGNSTLDPGDTVTASQYPISFDPCSSGVCTDVGNFMVTSFPVVAVLVNTTISIEVDLGSQTGVIYTDDSVQESFLAFTRRASAPGGSDQCKFGDARGALGQDDARVDALCPFDPATDYLPVLSPLNSVNGYFLEVEIY